MGCCELELEEMRLYQIVAKVKNQHRTSSFLDVIRCHKCNGILQHEFVNKHFIGFTVRIQCLQCGLEFEG